MRGKKARRSKGKGATGTTVAGAMGGTWEAAAGGRKRTGGPQTDKGRARGPRRSSLRKRGKLSVIEDRRRTGAGEGMVGRQGEKRSRP